jgi:phospholipid transport system transporter-binding protein
MSEAAVVTAQPGGGCSLSGELTFATVPQLWRDLERGGLLRSATVADLSAVSDADSAGLALLVAWRSRRRAAGADVGFVAPPERLMALARLTGAETILVLDQASGAAGASAAASGASASSS